MEKPMVSILCATYNQVGYIRDAVEGFLRQNTPFDYEVIIHDDASTDGTDEIIHEYAEKYPQIIYPLFEQENQMSKGINFWDAIYEKCRGKYYALCEGDDFWIDVNKLRIQVEYMEEHPECMMSVHNALVFHCDNQSFSLYGRLSEDHDLTPEEIIVERRSGFATASMVFRPEAVYASDSFYTAGKIGDWPLRLHVLAQGGAIHYFSRIMSVYRQGGLGSWGNRTYGSFVPALKHVWELIDLMEQYNMATRRRYEKYILARMQSSVSYLFSIAKTKDVQTFNALVDNCDEGFLLTHEDYVTKIKKLFSQFYDKNVIFETDEQENLKNSNHTVIYGAGKYGEKLARQIEVTGFSYDGFVVSEGQAHPETFMGKSVWTLDALPFAGAEVLVIVAIAPTIWDELCDNLKRYNLVHVICPLLYQLGR